MAVKKVIIIDGDIGAGKTTLIGILERELGARGYTVGVISEPVEEWKSIGLLQAFYEDVGRMAYEFQTYAYVTRIEESIKKYEELSVDILLMERSIFSDRYVFVEKLREDGMIDEMRYKMYCKWWDLWRRLMPFKITGVLYLRPELTECMSHIAKRGREGESKISIEYMRKIREYYDAYYMAGTNENKIFITTGGDFMNDEIVASSLTDDLILYLLS